MLLDLHLSTYPSFAAKPHCKSLNSIDLTYVTKKIVNNYRRVFHYSWVNCHHCFFICFIIAFLLLRNFLHWNIRWSAVCSSSSSSSHGHIGLSASPNLYRYDLIFPCPVSTVVNSENTVIFSRNLFLTDGKKALAIKGLKCHLVWGISTIHYRSSEPYPNGCNWAIHSLSFSSSVQGVTEKLLQNFGGCNGNQRVAGGGEFETRNVSWGMSVSHLNRHPYFSIGHDLWKQKAIR